MSQPAPVVIFDETSDKPIRLRLSADAVTALGIADAELNVKGVKLQGGMLLIDYQLNSTTLVRYLLAPSAIRWVRQDVTVSAPPPPPAQG
jgi:hypothetical protein